MKGYLILKKQYLFRGWTSLKHGVTDTVSGRTVFLPKNVYDTLTFCNGRFEEDSPVFMGARKEHLAEFIKHDLIEGLNEPGSLLPEQEYKEYDNRYIERVHWSMTGHCNYRCRHCYMSAPHAAFPKPDTAECRRIIDEIASCGIRLVSLTGGEALTREDFLPLVDYMLDKGIKIKTIMSNGALVSEELLVELEKRNCKPEFNMSYDGTEGWHDWLRGVEGAEKAVERAFLLCKEYGFPTGSEFCLHKGNAGTLRDSINMLSKWGVSSLKVSRLQPSGEAVNISDKALSCEEEYEIYMNYIPQYFEDGMPVKFLMLAGVFGCGDGKMFIPSEKGREEDADNRRFICQSARFNMYLGPDGRILPCIPMSETERSQEHFPSIAGMSLKEALTDSSYISFISTNVGTFIEHNSECAGCEFKYRCSGGCRGCAVVANNGTDLLGKDPSACTFYKGGYYDRVKELIKNYNSKRTADGN